MRQGTEAYGTTAQNYNKRYKEGYHDGITISSFENDNIFKIIFFNYLLKLKEIKQLDNTDLETKIIVGLVDFGCGDGRYLIGYKKAVEKINQYASSNHLPELILDIKGYDLSKDGIEIFESKAEVLGLAESVQGFVTEENIALTLEVIDNTSSKDLRDIILSGYGSLSSISPIRSHEYLQGFAKLGFKILYNMMAINGFFNSKPLFNFYQQDLLSGIVSLDRSKLYETDEGKQVLAQITQEWCPRFDINAYLDKLPTAFKAIEIEQGHDVFHDPGSLIYPDSGSEGNLQYYYHTDISNEKIFTGDFLSLAKAYEFLDTHKIAHIDKASLFAKPLQRQLGESLSLSSEVLDRLKNPQLDKLSNFLSKRQTKNALVEGMTIVAQKFESKISSSEELDKLKGFLEFASGLDDDSFMDDFHRGFTKYIIQLGLSKDAVSEVYIENGKLDVHRLLDDLRPDSVVAITRSSISR